MRGALGIRWKMVRWNEQRAFNAADAENMLGKCDKKRRCLALRVLAKTVVLNHPVRVAREIVQCVTDSQLFQWHAMENCCALRSEPLSMCNNREARILWKLERSSYARHVFKQLIASAAEGKRPNEQHHQQKHFTYWKRPYAFHSHRIVFSCHVFTRKWP